MQILLISNKMLPLYTFIPQNETPLNLFEIML